MTAKGNMPTQVGAAGALSAGAMLGQFRIEHKLGSGAMGEVWKAYDTDGDRPVVVKVLPPDLQGNATELKRAKDSFKRIHALHHQHICPVYLLGDDPRVGVYLVMKFLDAVELGEWARARGPLPIGDVVRILLPIASALDYAHAQKVLHRDVKTENILIGRDGQDVQLIDFGIATEIRAATSASASKGMDSSGTRTYMAPEQWQGELQDGKSDQYALAVVAYELLTGRVPFLSDDIGVLRQCVLQQPPPKIGGQSPAVNGVIAKGLAKSRSERYGSCVEFVNALGKPAVHVTPARAMPAMPGQRGQGPQRPGGPQVSGPMPALKPPPLSFAARLAGWQRSMEAAMGLSPEEGWKLWTGVGAAAAVIGLIVVLWATGMLSAPARHNI